ncbi:hypothetical protein Ait01nite_034210 [Actinoplanes italicus]|uniref:Uncharacterized protein n=1 Tax=Actinoplanes italicus TaxID=113567 RepID=A0A2T0K3N0_9ACTN|nr:hypothetical protein [Actinoplanes italicus]PRX17451.1 hypothetical protein CLV67_116227 [Actinoplanes italicus]GIE30376.1 hypothetical protein Ait01nite_034210 [Actinoplanes italicus]
MTDQKISPRFVFLDQSLEPIQVSPDNFIDAYPTASNPVFEVSKAGDTARIQLMGPDAGYQSALEWPKPDSGPVELAPALLEILEGPARDERGAATRALVEEIRGFLDDRQGSSGREGSGSGGGAGGSGREGH